MGIKDWFGGGKKKSEYREKVIDALADGKLTPEKMRELERIRRERELDHIADDKTMYRRDAYNAAVGAIKASGKLTANEEADLNKIQNYLNLRDDQVDKTQREVRRLKAVTDIEQGQLPEVSPESTVLKGLRLEAGEKAHYSAVADLFDCRELGAALGFKLAGDYRYGQANGMMLPVGGATPRDSGSMLLTSRRLIVRGGRTLAFDLNGVPEYRVFQDGLSVKSKTGYVLVKFRADGISDIVASLLLRIKK